MDNVTDPRIVQLVLIATGVMVVLGCRLWTLFWGAGGLLDYLMLRLAMAVGDDEEGWGAP